MRNKTQKGFTLFEMGLVLALSALGIVATMQMRMAESKRDTARSVAQVYELFNNAAGSYMTLYYKQIVEKGRTNPECGVFRNRVDDGTSGSMGVAQGCSIALKLPGTTTEIPVDNYLQPTPAELNRLNLLSDEGVRYQDNLPLPYDKIVHTYIGHEGPYARTGMAILIQLMCISPGTASPEPTTAPQTCSSNAFDLRSLVFNIHPYKNDLGGTSFMDQIRQAAGGSRTYLSGPLDLVGDRRELKADNGIKLRNPVRFTAYKGVDPQGPGVPNIIAMRNGYGSSGQDVFVRRDGSTALTADWNVGNQDITGIKSLSSDSARVSNNLNAGSIVTNNIGVSQNMAVGGKVTAGSVSAASVTTGSVSAEGVSALSVSAGRVSADSVSSTSIFGATGVFGGLVNTVQAALKSTTAYFSESLTVAGNTKLEGITRVAKIRLESDATLGGDCLPADETIRRAKETSDAYLNKSLRLLVCDPLTSKWVTPQAEYGTSISQINNNITNISQNVTNLQGKKYYTETQTLVWYAASYNSTSGMYTTIPYLGGTGRGRTWQPTSWPCHPNDANSSSVTTSEPYHRDGGVLTELNSNAVYPAIAPPVLLSLDAGSELDQTLVYDVACLYPPFVSNYPRWHVAMGPKERNTAYGNACRSGLGSGLDRPLNDKYYISPWNCNGYNILAPNFNAKEINARVMAIFHR